MFNQLCQLIKDNNSNTNVTRLEWDQYFMSIALLASQRSPCNRLKVGSVIVKNNRIVSMGYNGYISGAPHISRVINNHEQSIIHSEINALADCAKRSVSLENTNSVTIYVTHYPCLNCFRSIAATGIKKVIYLEDYKNDLLVEELANDAKIEVIKLI